MTPKTLHIPSRDGRDKICADLHLPAGEPIGVVVTIGPLTSVRTQASGAYAAAVADRGYAGASALARGSPELSPK
ncbi:MAG: hypothetical protein V9G19_21870 [Tetrasphaera sp.]